MDLTTSSATRGSVELAGRRLFSTRNAQLLGQALTDVSEHCNAAGRHHIAVEVLTDVNIALHDGLEGGGVGANSLWKYETSAGGSHLAIVSAHSQQ